MIPPNTPEESRDLSIHRRLRTAFIPIWPLNPYHTELRTALSAAKVDVWCPSSLKAAYRGLVSGNEQLDLLHLHALPYFGLKPNSFARYLIFFWRLTRILKRGIPIAWTVHEIDNHDSAHLVTETLFMRFLSRRVDAIIVHGLAAKRLVAEKFRISESRIHVVPHGNYLRSYENKISRDSARASLGYNSNHLVLLFFGHLRPYKGILEMVAAFRKIENSAVQLVIAGLPIATMEQQIANASIGDIRIKFIPGRIKENDVQMFMNASDVVVLPYKRILTSGAAVLAMSFGKACVAPRAGCVTDMMDETGTIFFDPLKEGDLERALHDAIQAQSKLSDMGAHNLQKARQWDWETIGQQTAAVYRQCIAARKNQA